MPITPGGRAARKHVVYIGRLDLFRFVSSHPFTCVEYVDFRPVEKPEGERPPKFITRVMPGGGLGTFRAPFQGGGASGVGPPQMVRVVEFINCTKAEERAYSQTR